MNTQSFQKKNDVKSKTSHKETPKAQDLDIEREFLVLPTEKGSFESEKSCKNAPDLKGVKDSFYNKQEPLNAISKALDDRSIEEAVLLAAKEPTSLAVSDENPKEAPEIRGEDQHSFLNLSIIDSYDQQQLEPLKASSSSLRSYLFALQSKINSFGSLQDLDFTRCMLEKQAIKALCSNSNLKSLKSLILTENPIRNDGIKFIAETSYWPKLQTLIISNTEIDYDGIKWLAMNESWTCLKDLDLSDNPLIGDLGAISLCLNRTWKSLNNLGLWGCNVGKLVDAALRQNRIYRALFAKDKTSLKDQNQNISFNKFSFRTTRNTQNPEKSLPTYPLTCSNWRPQNFECEIRGGSPQGDGSNDSSGIDYSALLTKFQQYKEKILNDTSLQKKLNLFVEVHVKAIPANHHGTNNENKNDKNQPLEPSFEIRRHLLNCEDSGAFKILLLTGQAGSGKSLFCKHFQRELLSDWSQNPEPEDGNWFPIYIELSSLNDSKSEAISEALSRELFLTDEEILFLQGSEHGKLWLPRLLFVFDDYGAFEKICAFHSLSSREEFMDKNFFVLNKINHTRWRNVKFIITCREEHLQKVQRRDLLFGPRDTESTELLVVSDVILQRRIEPFSNEQITSYLKKYCCYELKDTVKQGSSRNQAKELEQMIDDCHLRDRARTPFMLWIICQTLPKIMTDEPGQIEKVKSLLSQKLSNRIVIKLFINEVTQSMAKESSDASNNSANKEEVQDQAALHMKEIRQQAQNFALKLSGYSINQVVTEYDLNGDTFPMKLDPLVTRDNSDSRLRFDHRLLHEFLVAKSIEEEIRETVASKQEQWLKIKEDLLINQRLLTREASDLTVIFFLIDAIKDKRLILNQFINLIHLSRPKEENDDEELSSVRRSSSKPLFAIAASNAITILNAAGYDFSHQDLSNISIPSANLSFGVFEGTNFINANLAGVDFTGARLTNANFVKANLEGINFGEIPSLTLDKQEIKNIAYSLNGEYFAVDVGAETLILDVVDIQRGYFKEIKRFPGNFLGWRELNRTQVLTIHYEKNVEENENENISHFKNQYEDDDQYSYKESNVWFYIWDAISGKSIEKFKVPIGEKRILNFNLKRKEVIVLNNRKVQKYDIASGSWIIFPNKIQNDVKNGELLAKSSTIFLIGDYQTNTILYSLITGKVILKQRQTVTSCKLSPDGQKIVAGTSLGVIHISDCVRGYIIKSLVSENREEEDEQKAVFDCSFNAGGKQILSRTGKRLFLQDIAEFKLSSLPLPSTELNNCTYCLSPYGQQIAIVEEIHTLSLKKSPMVADLSIQTPVIRGTNNEGLNLQGVIANSSSKLSEKNIALLQKRGDYGIFDESMIKKLFSNNSADSENIREVVLIEKKLTSIHAKIIGRDELWMNLQRLDLSRNHIGEEGGKAIGNNKIWTNLEELILIKTEIGDETAKAIATNNKFQKLKKLQLESNKIGDVGAEAIGENEIWMRLETLDLRQNRIKDDGALAIGNNKTWTELQTLELKDNLIGPKGVEGLSQNQAWINLQKLNLENNLIDVNGARELIRNTYWVNLKTLELRSSSIGDKAARELSSNTSWINLKILDLGDNSIGAEGASELAGNKIWINLQTLKLRSNSIGEKGAAELAEKSAWINLQALKLHNNSIGAEGTKGLSKNKSWINLQTLGLRYNSIDAEGAAGLAENTSWINLQTLDLGNNSIRDKGARELSRNTSWTNLKILNLYNNLIGKEGAPDLAENTSWISLQTLDLGENCIGSEGAAGLGRNKSWINLQTLDLRNNSIGPEGAAELGKNASWINLQTLNLKNNNINKDGDGDGAGAGELARNTSWINLRTLDLKNNLIGHTGALELNRNTSWINLETLDLRNNPIGNLNDAEVAAELGKNSTWPKTLKILYSHHS